MGLGPGGIVGSGEEKVSCVIENEDGEIGGWRDDGRGGEGRERSRGEGDIRGGDGVEEGEVEGGRGGGFEVEHEEPAMRGGGGVGFGGGGGRKA